VSALVRPGSRLGRWKVLGLVGRGGMGEVYVASDAATGERVALKVLGRGAGLSLASAQRFERERELLARVAHPGVVRVLGALETDDESGLSFFPMELVIGKSLGDLLAEHGRFAIVEAVRVLAATAEALEATHERGIVHRDVKPSNVLIARSGAVRLTDFGLARALDSSRFTITGSALGTPAYMSPEQCSGKDAGPEADHYALGVVAHELLAGSPPFQAESPLAVLRLHADAKPKPLRELRPEVPARLEALVLRLLEKDPAARGGSPRAGLDALHAELTGGNADFVKRVHASIDRDTVTVAALVEPARRGERLPASSVGLAVLAAVGLGAAFFRSAPPAPPPPAPAVVRATVLLQDRTSLAGTLAAIDSGALTLEDERGVARVVSLSSVQRIEYR
jgi:serine/threonine-protein kinase